MMTRYCQQAYPWVTGNQPVNLGVSGGPRLSALGESTAQVKPWPSSYAWALMGLYPAGQWPLFQLGYTAPVFNNQLSPAPFGYNYIMPGMARTPFGG